MEVFRIYEPLVPSSDRYGSNPASNPCRMALRECSIATGTARVPKISIAGRAGLQEGTSSSFSQLKDTGC